ncbi:hypothetical protein B0T21DRAFT_376513 [Apiosordaria backusii]|uniref:Uncharacterized protein n=1 Tax=Apiosordaria backusii TaxID=314023 RepID=A0AA40A6Z8_9PEZI|nr:hypothetical protein B0T21DRAFT_376513 [Apiosordaria backusii]
MQPSLQQECVLIGMGICNLISTSRSHTYALLIFARSDHGGCGLVLGLGFLVAPYLFVRKFTLYTPSSPWPSYIVIPCSGMLFHGWVKCWRQS